MAELLFIGTGDAFCSGGRRNSAILLRGRHATLLLDCGPTTMVGLQELGVDPGEIDAIAISHFHGDHTAGLPMLMLDYTHAHRRDRELLVLGPPGIEARLEQQSRSFEYWDEPRPFPVRFQEFDCARALETEHFTLTPFPAVHNPNTCPHMMRVDLDGRSVFFSGDTGWHDELPRRVGPADLFICEATLLEEGFEYHLSCVRLEQERERFECKRIVLTHLGPEVLENLDRIPFEPSRDGLRLEL